MTTKSHNVFFASSHNSLIHSGFNSFGNSFRRWRIVDKPDGFNYGDGSILVNDDFPPYSAFQLQLTGESTSWFVGMQNTRQDLAIDKTVPLDTVKIQQAAPFGPDEEIPCTGIFTNEGMRYIVKHLFHSNVERDVVRVRLIDSVGFSEFSVSDTFASHPGWTELVSSYQPTFEVDGQAPEENQLDSLSNEGTLSILVDINGVPDKFAFIGVSDAEHIRTQNVYTSIGTGVRDVFEDPVPYPLFVNFRTKSPDGGSISSTPAPPSAGPPFAGNLQIQRDPRFPRFGNATWFEGVPEVIEAPPRGFFVIKENTRDPSASPVILFGLLLDRPFTSQIPDPQIWGTVAMPTDPTGRLGYDLSFTLTGLLE